MEQVLQQILGELKELRQGQDDINHRLTKFELYVENEITDKISGLFDARQMTLDYLASIRDSLARIEQNVEMLSRRAFNLESELERHEREMRLLRVEKQ